MTKTKMPAAQWVGKGLLQHDQDLLSEMVAAFAQLLGRQTVLTGFLLGGAVAELAVVNIDENDKRRWRIYAFGNGAWEQRLDATTTDAAGCWSRDGRGRRRTIHGGTAGALHAGRQTLRLCGEHTPPPPASRRRQGARAQAGHEGS